MNAQELRAEADRMDAEAAKANRGKVYISPYTGSAFVHDGGRYDQTCFLGGTYRDATPAEIEALRTIPEFAARLNKVRGA